MAQGEAGQAIRLVHRVAAVFFGLVPITYTHPPAAADAHERERVFDLGQG